jgi:putative copper export protein
LAWWVIEAVIGGGAWMHSEAAAFGIARAVLLGLAAAVAASHRRRFPALLAVAALATMLAGGHPGGAVVTALLLGAHLLAASVWLGAAPALLLMQHDAAVSNDEAHRATKAFSRTATFAIVAIFGGGVLLGAQLTDGFAGGLTLYVALLLAKSGLAGAALIGGALARRRLVAPGATPAKQRGALQKLFAVDVAILMVVTGLSAALTLGSPHEGHAAKSGVGYCAIALPDDEAYLTLNPGRVGENLLLLAEAPAATSLSLEFAQPGVSGVLLSDLTSRSAGTDGAAWQGSAILPQVGAWRVTLVIRPDRFSEVRGTCIMEILP